MTETGWLTCGSRQQMRGVIKSRPFASIRWVLFNLACVERVRGLLTDQRCLYLVEELARYAADPARNPTRAFDLEEEAVRAAIRELWVHHPDPLREARVAAARAVLTAGSRTFATSEMVIVADRRRRGEWFNSKQPEQRIHCHLVRDIFGNPFRRVSFSPGWRTSTAISLAKTMYDSRHFSAMPILADALQDAGCDNDDILNHCRDAHGIHVRGCWVVDLVLGKE